MKKIVVSLALSAVFVSSASAAVIFSESFDYALADNASLAGTNNGIDPATGVAPSGTWTATYQTGNGLQFKTTGLSHALVTGTGGAVATASNSAALPGGALRSFDAAAVPTTDGNVYWGRILFDFNDLAPGASVATQTSATGNAAGDAVRLFSNGGGTGLGFEMYSSGGVAYTRATIGTGVRVFGNEVSFDHMNTQLMVFKITFGETEDQVDLWLNPTSLNDESSLGVVSSSVTGATSESTAGLYLRRHTASNNWVADEFVFGNTFADIAIAVPEPSSFAALAGLGTLAFVASRRRRKA
jgi:hypothetical protein